MTDIQGEELPSTVLVVSLVPPDGMNSTSFTESLLGLVLHDASSEGRVVRGGGPMLIPTTPMRLVDNRNYAAKWLLDDSDADWLMFIDSDMGFEPDAVEKLLKVADPAERPVVGGLCFGLRKEESDGLSGWRSVPFPTIYDWRTADGAPRPGFMARYGYSPETVTQCAATGAAFLLIHRSALEAIRAELGDVWFERAKMYPDDEPMGEDISFCSRLGLLGIPLFVHTGVRTSHLKPLWVTEEYYQGFRVLHALKAKEAGDA